MSPAFRGADKTDELANLMGREAEWRRKEALRKTPPATSVASGAR